MGVTVKVIPVTDRLILTCPSILTERNLMPKKSCFLKDNKLLIIISTIFTVIILILCSVIYSLKKQIDGAFDSIGTAAMKANSLESDLRNRGIINGELIINSENSKPYSLEQMQEFQKYINENYKK